MSRSRRCIFDDLTRAELLKVLRVARAGCINAQSKVPIGGDVHRAENKVMDAIDDAAGVLTGSRGHFHLKAHSSPASGAA